MIRTAPEGLLDKHTATSIFQNAGLSITSAHPEYLRYKHGETTIVSYLFTTSDSGTARGYVRWCADPARATQVFRKAKTLRPRPTSVGVSITQIDDHTVLYGFPNDARLRRLRWYTTPRKLKHSLATLVPSGQRVCTDETSSVVLRYKPERRLVAAVNLKTLHGPSQRLLVRYATSRRTSALADVAHQLRNHGVRTPKPLAQLDEGRVVVDEFIAGSELRSVLLNGPGPIEELAVALLQIHRTPPLAGFETRTRAGLAARAISALSGLETLHQSQFDVADLAKRAVIQQIPDEESELGFVHGDLHQNNILVAANGVVFIDLERAAVGAAATDLGCLLGYAIGHNIRGTNATTFETDHASETIESYQSLSGGIDSRALAWHTAIALIDQALLVARRPTPGWAEISRELLAAAIAQVKTTSRSSTKVPG